MEIEAAFDDVHETSDYIAQHMLVQQDQKAKGGGIKDFTGANGRNLAILDALRSQKTRMAVPCATRIAAIADNSRSPPKHVRLIFEAISTKLGWSTGTPTS